MRPSNRTQPSAREGRRAETADKPGRRESGREAFSRFVSSLARLEKSGSGSSKSPAGSR